MDQREPRAEYVTWFAPDRPVNGTAYVRPDSDEGDCPTCSSPSPELMPVRDDAPPTTEWIGMAEDPTRDCPDSFHSAIDQARGR